MRRCGRADVAAMGRHRSSLVSAETAAEGYRFVKSANWFRRLIAKIPTNASTGGRKKRYMELLDQ
jgi:hypothetical protein